MSEMTNKYKEIADELYEFYMALIESGFDPDQSFELISAYTRQSVLDNVIQGIYESRARKFSKGAIVKRNRELIDRRKEQFDTSN